MSDNSTVDDDVDLSSSDSSPVNMASLLFHPRFRITVPDAVKNGECLQFTIKVYKVCTGTHLKQQFLNSNFYWS